MFSLPAFNQEMQSQIKSDSVLFFDLDGTLVDSDYANYLAYQAAFNTVTGMDSGIAFNRFERFNRRTLMHAFPYLSQEQLSEIVRYKEIYAKQYLQYTALIAPTATLLKQYSRTHHTVLVSHCRAERAQQTLDFYDLHHDFDEQLFRQDNEDKPKNKYQHAIDYLGVTPSSVIVFENEFDEISNAIHAGVTTINPGVNLSLWKALLLKKTTI